MKTRQEVIVTLQRLYGSGIEVDLLIDYLQDAWETTDLLVRFFGPAYAHHAIMAPSCIRSSQEIIADVDESVLN